jgi:Ni/Fe-hydrogenase b-type cytochrome subunit
MSLPPLYARANIRRMAESVQLRELAIRDADVSETPRHLAVVRITHWITAIAFFVLLLSGIAILLAHPRLYWGETGARGGPSLIDLPLPFVLDVPIRGPGRYLHFTFAWVCVLTGLFYGLYGFFSRHFHKNLLPTKDSLSWSSLSQHLKFSRPTDESASTYNVVQRLAYLGVVFVLFPLMIWTGLGMSPAATSVFPWLATAFGGQQSARTIHFFTTIALVLFVLVHVVMVFRAGFNARTWAMITGRISRKERS